MGVVRLWTLGDRRSAEGACSPGPVVDVLIVLSKDVIFIMFLPKTGHHPVAVLSSRPEPFPHAVTDSIVGGVVVNECSASFCLGILPLELVRHLMTGAESSWQPPGVTGQPWPCLLALAVLRQPCYPSR